MIDIGSKVRFYRRKNALTQEALASLAGLSISSIRKVEAGTVTSPRSDSIQRIAAVLGIPVAALVDPEYKERTESVPKDNERSHLLGVNYLRLQNMSTDKLRVVDQMIETWSSLSDDEFQNPRKP